MISRNATRCHLSVSVVAVSAVLVAACGQRPAAEQPGAQPSSAPPAATSGAVPPADSSPSPTATSGSSSADVEPGATQALDKMGAYLRTLKAFHVKSATSRDDVLDDGQKIEFDGTVDLLMQRPDRLRVEIDSDRQNRIFFYDGKSFTMWGPRVNYYATAPAPATVGELNEILASKYGIEVPLADLFYWGQRQVPGEILAANDIGPSQVEGTSCEHYAFHGREVDFQLWIQQGDYPLPRKIVITTLTDNSRPQYRSVLNWNLAPSYNDAAFKFEPPASATKIAFAEATRSK